MSPVAIVWPCPLAVDAYATAGRDLGFPRPDCPSCAGPLVFWAGYRRYVREAGRYWKMFAPRLRCARCGVSHALLPAFTLAWRLDVAETIGSVVGEVVAGGGCGVRPAAERAGCRTRPPAAGSAGSGPVPRSWGWRSTADPARNPHRTAAGWTLGTVTTILQNPRYTGRQVWNRQRTDTELADPGNVTLGHKNVQRWNLPDGWVISNRQAHPALVSEADFIAVQDVNAARGAAPHNVPVLRRYLLAGLLTCGRGPSAPKTQCALTAEFVLGESR